jgi:hypothetical protein
MKNQFYLIIMMSMLCTVMTSQAQVDKDARTDIRKNYAKINLPGLAIRNYGLQYERAVSKRVSFALGYRFMPTGPIPFKSTILESGNNTPEAEKAINSIELSNMAITPEIRFYMGKKGYGRGFYIAPFYRYGNFKASGVELEYEGDGGATETLLLRGDVKGNTFGLMFGAQWALGKNICLDWFILGPHYGTGSGNLTGLSSMVLNQDQQNEILTTLSDIDIPLVEETYTVNANSASVSLKGPWAGIRAGLSLGIRF